MQRIQWFKLNLWNSCKLPKVICIYIVRHGNLKTKEVILIKFFTKKKKNRENPAYIYNNESIAVVDDFVYLCITFTHNAYFTKHKNSPFRIESKSYV